MVDRRLRELHRNALLTRAPDDKVAYLAECLRSGSLPAARVRLARYLGHPTAEALLGGKIPLVSDLIDTWCDRLGLKRFSTMRMVARQSGRTTHGILCGLARASGSGMPVRFYAFNADHSRWIEGTARRLAYRLDLSVLVLDRSSSKGMPPGSYLEYEDHECIKRRHETPFLVGRPSDRMWDKRAVPERNQWSAFYDWAECLRNYDDECLRRLGLAACWAAWKQLTPPPLAEGPWAPIVDQQQGIQFQSTKTVVREQLTSIQAWVDQPEGEREPFRNAVGQTSRHLGTIWTQQLVCLCDPEAQRMHPRPLQAILMSSVSHSTEALLRERMRDDVGKWVFGEWSS